MRISTKKLYSNLISPVVYGVIFALVVLATFAQAHSAFAASSITFLSDDVDTSTEVMDAYVGDTLRFSIMSDGDFTGGVYKYASPTSSEKILMDAAPDLVDGVYELPLTVVNDGNALTDFTPGNYVMDIYEGEEVAASVDFNVLSNYSDVQVDIDNPDQVFLTNDLNFTATYKLRDNAEFEASPETPPAYESYISINEENPDDPLPGTPVIIKLEEGDFTNYSLHDGVVTVPLGDDLFSAGNYYIVTYTVLYDGSPDEIEYPGKVESLSYTKFTINELLSASLSPDEVANPELSDEIDFTTSFEVTNGSETTTVSILPDGLVTLNVYKNANALTPVEPAEDQTLIIDNGDGNYTLYVNPDLFEENTYYGLTLEEDTDKLVKPYDSFDFWTLEGNLVTSITENLSDNFSPTFSTGHSDYTISAGDGENYITFDVETPDEDTKIEIASDNDNNPVVEGNQATSALADGDSLITITATNQDGSRVKTFNFTVTKAENNGDDGDTSGDPSSNTVGGGGGAPHHVTPPSNTVTTLSIDDDDQDVVNPNTCVTYELNQDTDFSAISNHWAAPFITSLLSTRLVGPETAGVLDPNGFLTRADATKMLFCTSGNTYKTGLTGFLDSSGHPMADLLATAKSKGIVNGYGDGTFHPYASISRAEFLAIIFNAYGIEAQPNGHGYFKDVVSDSWYEDIVDFAFEKGIVSGVSNGYFAPHNRITRAEAAKIIFMINQNF